MNDRFVEMLEITDRPTEIATRIILTNRSAGLIEHNQTIIRKAPSPNEVEQRNHPDIFENGDVSLFRVTNLSQST